MLCGVWQSWRLLIFQIFVDSCCHLNTTWVCSVKASKVWSVDYTEDNPSDFRENSVTIKGFSAWLCLLFCFLSFHSHFRVPILDSGHKGTNGSTASLNSWWQRVSRNRALSRHFNPKIIPRAFHNSQVKFYQAFCTITLSFPWHHREVESECMYVNTERDPCLISLKDLLLQTARWEWNITSQAADF